MNNNSKIVRSMREDREHTGTWMSLGSSVISEMAGYFDFEWILYDLEHGYITEQALISNFQAIRNENTAIIVRVGSVDPVLISRVLDWGAAGIMLPHVNSAEEAKSCIQAMYYPPLGNRGYSSTSRSFEYGLNKNTPEANAFHPIFMAQIETLEAVGAAKSIAAVPGVDVLFVGPADLKLCWSVNQRNTDPESFWELLAKVAVAADSQKKLAGILIKNISDIPRLRNLGYKVFSIGSDLGTLKEGYSRIFQELRKL